MADSRFAAAIGDEQEGSMRLHAIPENTRSATDWGIRVWKDWAGARASSSSSEGRCSVSTPLLLMPVDDFAYWLGKFILEARKKDGTEYPPKSLYALVCSFKRFFETNERFDVNPLTPSDTRFGGFRQTLDAEMKRLHKKGLGTNPSQAEPISPDEESLLWAKGQLGTHCGRSLQNTVYYYNCKVFGLRSYDEHHDLQCSQFEKKLDEQGRVYLEYTDFGSKTNAGGLKHLKVENKHVRQYENPADPDHCVVNIFETYLSCIPYRTGKFYFRPLADDGSGVPKFARQSVGRNRFASIIPDMCKAADIKGRKTGHSGKVTCATSLYRQNFDDQLIKERTGHRSIEALHKYKRTGSDQQHEVSMALLPPMAKKAKKEIIPPEDKENMPQDDDIDDFKPLKKKPKVPYAPDLQGLFPHSSMTNCTFNFTIQP